MNITTTIHVSWDEIKRYGITDEQMHSMGYRKTRQDTIGKTYEKAQWSVQDIKEL